MQTATPLVRDTCLALLIALCGTQASHACSVPPREQLISVDELIAGARDVSLAKVVGMTDIGGGRARYDFVVQQRLRGDEREAFSLHGRLRPGEAGRSASDHSEAAFWQRGGGRLMNDSDCVIRPDFYVGETYLVFLGQPATWRSFERIASAGGVPPTNDKWFVYVEEKLRAMAQQ